ncbi:GNAT family N-acetyltransferase [Paenibacillus xylaniclasticus]|uniref:GNAT family N-acetyltransferase n=1 Tax=Paenibacillus xylaniclasticus TaxID=588083 RepID=UPI000FD7ED25|nr:MULTISPECIES: GNAT family N-acetyltransferase [Paenibacillus]GFN32841.1 N-acetyltransferase [Paenibacillus curdlanolyticus]
MKLRKATNEDALPVAQLIYEAIHDIAFQLTGETTKEQAITALAELFRQPGNRFSAKQVVVAEEGGLIAGMILCYHGSEADKLDAPIVAQLRKRKGNSDLVIDKEADEDEYYIDSIAVFPQFRGRGIAKALLQAAEEAAAACGWRKIALNVEYGNDRAARLYRAFGYTPDKTITINGSSFYHMVKLITLP